MLLKNASGFLCCIETSQEHHVSPPRFAAPLGDAHGFEPKSQLCHDESADRRRTTTRFGILKIPAIPGWQHTSLEHLALPAGNGAGAREREPVGQILHDDIPSPPAVRGGEAVAEHLLTTLCTRASCPGVRGRLNERVS